LRLEPRPTPYSRDAKKPATNPDAVIQQSARGTRRLAHSYAAFPQDEGNNHNTGTIEKNPGVCHKSRRSTCHLIVMLSAYFLVSRVSTNLAKMCHLWQSPFGCQRSTLKAITFRIKATSFVPRGVLDRELNGLKIRPLCSEITQPFNAAQSDCSMDNLPA
jgi:hypothetical protein